MAPARWSDFLVQIVDDDDDVLESLRFLFETISMNVEAHRSADALIHSYQHGRKRRDVGCLVLDLRMPVMSGLEVLERYVPRVIDCPVVLVSAHSDVRTAVRAMKLGAFDFFEKPYDPQALLDTVNHACRIQAARQQERKEKSDLEARLETLTSREQEVLRLLFEISNNRDVAERLGVSHRTIEVHRSRIMGKMHVDNLTHLALALARHGLA